MFYLQTIFIKKLNTAQLHVPLVYNFQLFIIFFPRTRDKHKHWIRIPCVTSTPNIEREYQELTKFEFSGRYIQPVIIGFKIW